MVVKPPVTVQIVESQREDGSVWGAGVFAILTGVGNYGTRGRGVCGGIQGFGGGSGGWKRAERGLTSAVEGG